MLVSFIMIFSVITSGPTIPNYYPGLMAARDASRNAQKEMVVFFTDAACEQCASAWNAFAQDAKGTARFISTTMDIQDFDGRIYFELLGLEKTPSWVILHPDGTVKEQWAGGWKDEQGKIVSTPGTVNETMHIPAVQKPNAEISTHPSPPVIQPNEKPIVAIQGNYFIQAGYFGSETNAIKLINDLHAMGFDSYTAHAEQKEGKTYYRVLSALFENEQLASAEQRKLLSKGISAAVKKM